MARIRRRSADGARPAGAPRRMNRRSAAGPLLAVLVALAAGVAAARAPLSEDPVVWYAADDAPVPVPEFAEPGLIPYAVDSFLARPFSRFWNPGRLCRRIA